MDNHNHEESTALRMLGNFAIIFGVILIIEWIIFKLWKPFRKSGAQGVFLGFFAMGFLLLSLALLALAEGNAKQVEKIDYVTVKVPIAGAHLTPTESKKNIVVRAKQGVRFDNVKEYYYKDSDGRWVETSWVKVSVTGRELYIQKDELEIAFLHIKEKADFSGFFWFALGFYIVAVLAVWEEKKRQRKAKLEYLGLSGRQLS